MLALLCTIVIIYCVTISSAICVELNVQEYKQTGKIHWFSLVGIALVVLLNVVMFIGLFGG